MLNVRSQIYFGNFWLYVQDVKEVSLILLLVLLFSISCQASLCTLPSLITVTCFLATKTRIHMWIVPWWWNMFFRSISPKHILISYYMHLYINLKKISHTFWIDWIYLQQKFKFWGVLISILTYFSWFRNECQPGLSLHIWYTPESQIC